MFRRVGGLLSDVAGRGKKHDVIAALQVREAAKKAIDAICADLPDDIVKQVKIKSFKNGVLDIAAPSLLSAELYMRSEELRKGINDALKRNIVKGLRFRGG